MWEIFVLMVALGSDETKVGVDTRASYASYAECTATIPERLAGFEKIAAEQHEKLVFAMGCRRIKDPNERGAWNS